MAAPGIAPITPPESNAWWHRLSVIRMIKATDTLAEVRGVGVGYDLDPELTPGYAYKEQRNSAAAGMYNQGKRGKMSDIPTPQELIRQVTGIGSVPRGR